MYVGGLSKQLAKASTPISAPGITFTVETYDVVSWELPDKNSVTFPKVLPVPNIPHTSPIPPIAISPGSHEATDVASWVLLVLSSLHLTW